MSALLRYLLLALGMSFTTQRISVYYAQQTYRSNWQFVSQHDRY